MADDLPAEAAVPAVDLHRRRSAPPGAGARSGSS